MLYIYIYTDISLKVLTLIELIYQIFSLKDHKTFFTPLDIRLPTN